jgi:hypothetical protein
MNDLPGIRGKPEPQMFDEHQPSLAVSRAARDFRKFS